MTLSKRSIETILDLVEIKLNSMQIIDREDARELAHLESCRRELLSIKAQKRGGGKVNSAAA